MGLSKLLTSFAIVQSYWKLSFDYKKSGGKKVYFSGDGSMSIKNLPDDSIVRCPLKHLHPFTPCLPVRGLMLEGVYPDKECARFPTKTTVSPVCLRL